MRQAARLPLYLHVSEGEGTQTYAESFHGRLLSGKTRRQGRCRVGQRARISPLAKGKEPLRQFRAAGEDGSKAGHVDQVDAQPDQGGAAFVGSRAEGPELISRLRGFGCGGPVLGQHRYRLCQ